MATENMVNIPLSSDEENFAKNSNLNSSLQNKPELTNGVGKLYFILKFNSWEIESKNDIHLYNFKF